MRNLILLLKLRIANVFKISKLKETKKYKLLLYALFGLYIFISIISLIVTASVSAADMLTKYNLLYFLIILFYIVSMLMIFMFTVYNAKSSMFNSSDNDLLLSMPIKSSTILASRLIYVIAFNLLTTLLIMVPAFIVYSMNAGITIMSIISFAIIILLLPLIPTILASLFGYLVAYVSSKTNAKNWIEFGMSILLMILVYYFTYSAGNILNYIVLHFDKMESILKWGLYPAFLVGEVLKNNNYLSLLIYIIFNISLFVIFIYILSFKFKKIIVKLQENKTKSNYVMPKLKTISINKTLLLKEFKRYISSPVYLLNTSFGLILILGGAIATIFYSQEKILKLLEINAGSASLFSLVATLIIFVSFMSSTTSATISIEGKNFWILKTLPISPRKIFDGKLMLNIILIIIPTIISIIIFFFTLHLSIIEFLALVIIAIIVPIASSQFGLILNLKFPKMDAIDDVVIVKRSLSVMIAVLLPMAVVFGFMALNSLIKINISSNIIIIIVIIVLALLNVIQHIILSTWGVKRFKQI